MESVNLSQILPMPPFHDDNQGPPPTPPDSDEENNDAPPPLVPQIPNPLVFGGNETNDTTTIGNGTSANFPGNQEPQVDYSNGEDEMPFINRVREDQNEFDDGDDEFSL